MLYLKNNQIAVSKSPHSLGVQNNMTIPSPGFDENPLIIGEKKALAAGLQGLGGLFGTSLFEGGLDPNTWGNVEWIITAIGGWMVWTLFEQVSRDTKRIKYRLEDAAYNRRSLQAKELRARAKHLEEKRGIFF